MDRRKKKILAVSACVTAFLAVFALVAAALIFMFVESASAKKAPAHRAGYPAADAPRGETGRPAVAVKPRGVGEGGEKDERTVAGEIVPESAEKGVDERREEEENKRVDDFYSLTDKWMKKGGDEVAMKDMDDFVAAFKAVPDSRKDECLHRALNLVHDDNVLLLAGILFDKSLDRKYLELVFSDVLNRNEEVKKLILAKIFKDREHPCWADTAWILDVTGELPNKEKNNE